MVDHQNRYDESAAAAAAASIGAAAVTPVFPVVDISAAADHYEAMGFVVEKFPDAGYAYVRAGRAEIQLNQVHDLDPSTSTSVCYLYVQDADVLFERWRDSDAVGGHLIPPKDMSTGVREFGHVDIDGNLLRVASPIA